MKTKVCDKCRREYPLSKYEVRKRDLKVRPDCNSCKRLSTLIKRGFSGKRLVVIQNKLLATVGKTSCPDCGALRDSACKTSSRCHKCSPTSLEKRREYSRKHYHSGGGKESAAKRGKGRVRHYSKEERRKWRLENRDRVNKAARDRYRNDPEKRAKIIASVAKRRCLEGGATVSQIEERFDFHGNKCIYCGCGGPMEIEHMIPVSRGGTNWPANLAPACRSCNSSKGSKTFFEFKGIK